MTTSAIPSAPRAGSRPMRAAAGEETMPRMPNFAHAAAKNRACAVFPFMAAALLGLSGCARIKPDEVGVKTVNLGPAKGIVQKDFGPGYYRYLWPIEVWNRFPCVAQRIRFSRDAAPAGVMRDDAIHVTSADGDRVMISAEVFFRIADDAAHKLLQDSGPGERHKQVVKNLAQDAARAVFGLLGTESFYDVEKRESRRHEAIELLRARLTPRGIELIDFLVESIEFDTNYENLIKTKKIADQRVELSKSMSLAAEERGKVAFIRTETTARVQELNKEAESKMTLMKTEADITVSTLAVEAGQHATRLRADAELYRKLKAAEGARLIKTAEADGTLRLNQALSGGGTRNLVALEAARQLNLPEVVFPSSGIDWFNPHEMAARLGGGDFPDEPAGNPEEEAGP